MTDEKKELPPKQRVFLEEYLRTWNATEAARIANYAHPNTQGPRLLVNVRIQEAIQERLAEKAMTADEVLARLAEQARMSIAPFVFEDSIIIGEGENIKAIDAPGLNWEAIKEHGHLIKSIRGTPNGPVIELHDAQKALIHLGKNHALFTDRTQLTNPDGGNVVLDVFVNSIKKVYGDDDSDE